MDFEEDFLEIGKECIMYFDKKGCIDDIVKISRLPEHKVVNVVNYLINDGKMNFENTDKTVMTNRLCF